MSANERVSEWVSVLHLRACLNIQYVIILTRRNERERDRVARGGDGAGGGGRLNWNSVGKGSGEKPFRLNGRPCHIT